MEKCRLCNIIVWSGRSVIVPGGLANGTCISAEAGVTQDSDLDQARFNYFFFNPLLGKVMEYRLINLLEDTIPGGVASWNAKSQGCF